MPESNAQSAPTWIGLSEAVEVLGVHETTVRRWADSGAIKTIRTPGRQRRFSREDCERIAREGVVTEAVADAGFSALDATFPAAAVLAAVFLALALPGGTAAALAALAVIVGVGVREALAAHLRGRARLARAAHRGRRDRFADVERRESAIAVRRIYGGTR